MGVVAAVRVRGWGGDEVWSGGFASVLRVSGVGVGRAVCERSGCAVWCVSAQGLRGVVCVRGMVAGRVVCARSGCGVG